VRAVTQVNLSASLHDPRKNQRAWSCGCRATAKLAKATTVGEATAKCNRPVHRGTGDGTYEQTRRLNWGPSLFLPVRDVRIDSEFISCRLEGRGADEVVVSVDPPGHYNPVASQGPLDRIVSGNFLLSFPSRGSLDRKVHYRWKTNGALAAYKLICFAADQRRSRSNSCLKPYWGKPAVRNFRGGGENTGISHWGVLCVPSLLGVFRSQPIRRCILPVQVRSRE
jgi:hypothetical protein